MKNKKGTFISVRRVLAYMRDEIKVPAEVIRQIAQFLLGAEQPIPRIPQPRENVTNIVQLSVEG